ncbi:MAG: DUF1566 domain-containing protein [Acidobacteria bacterium]|nr:DUF1566 domain-containing protein [Acidobacteriota bacterium]
MFKRRCFNRLALSLIVTVFLYAGAAAVICQDKTGTWEDADTGLLWTTRDSDSEMNWDQANNYCKNLDLEGRSDWRLPTRAELKSLYDRSLKKQFKIKGPIELGGASIWSADVNNSGDAWSFNFFNGGTSMSPTRGGCGGSGRALCVHSSGEQGERTD